MHEQRSIWWAHARWPIPAFVVLATLLESTHLDRTLAAAWYFDPAHHSWIGADAIWANAIVHTGGGWAIRSIAALALLVWAGSLCLPALHRMSRTTAFILVSMALSIGLVGVLKQLSNIDCPWDLQEFGGRFPFVPLLADRPDSLRPAHCFPAAHASSGFTLVVFYFALREHHAGWARWALWMSVLVGLVFGIAQQARGAHFLSHDVWSAFLVWVTTLSVYVFGFGATLAQVPCPRIRTAPNAIALDNQCVSACNAAHGTAASPS